MAKVTFESLIPNVLPQVQGCTDLLIVRALRQAAEEFLTHSRSWRVTLDPQVTVANLADYDIEVPYSYTKAVQVVWVEIDGKRITQVGDDNRARSGDGASCHLDAFGKVLTVKPTPTASETMQLRVALSILPTTSAIDDTVMWHMFDAIIDGALFRLLTMPDQEWSNNSVGMLHAELFHKAILQAKREAEQNGGSAVRKVRYGGI